ncbi:MAG: methyltransferase domain-containing protein [Myxococcaceae bacterium]|nr:methyltransferase domain-containing protein [Myxococcaceae bacterium]
MHLALPESAKQETVLRRSMPGGWYVLMRAGCGIDVGAGKALPAAWRWWEPAGLECDPWDVDQGDAHFLAGVEDASYAWLYSSHCLEHLADPDLALRNWLRVVRPGGRLFIAVPHRELYERRAVLPSNFNHEHLRYYLPHRGDGVHTVGLHEWLSPLQRPLGFDVERIETCDWGCTNVREPHQHAVGEYQLEVTLWKR